jgi:hypothetical protein
MSHVDTPTNGLDRTLMLLEYGSCKDPLQAELLFEHRGSLKRYLDNGWLVEGFHCGKPAVLACDHVGILPYSVAGQHRLLMIAPKGCKDDETIGLRRFLELVALSEGEPMPKEFSGWEGQRGPHRFLLFLSQHYANLLTELCRRDFRSYYRSEEGELRGFVRGRLTVSAYVRNEIQGRPHKLPCEWDEFTIDNWDNRILWAAARALKAMARTISPEAARLVWKPFHQLTSWFSPVSDVTITSTDFHRSRLGRTSGYYRRALAWAKMLLQGSELPAAGGHATPIVLDAPRIFEKFAESVARDALPDSAWHPHFQHQLDFLIGRQTQRHQPDIFLAGPNGIAVVGDTKYKEVLQRTNVADLGDPGRIRLAIQASDWNQLYVYMRMKRAAMGFFIVPFWDARGDHVHLETDLRFVHEPLDAESPSRLAVIGLNLFRDMSQVKREAVKALNDWLQK